MRIVTAESFKVVPWRNGQGTTMEVWVDPSEADKFAWRLSVATIEASGAFSRFDGYERIIVPLAGGEIALAHANERPIGLSRFRPHAFSGSLETWAELSGEAATDFNFIVRQGLGAPRIEVQRDRAGLQAALRRQGLVACFVWRGRVAFEERECFEAPFLLLPDSDSVAIAEASSDLVALTASIVAKFEVDTMTR